MKNIIKIGLTLFIGIFILSGCQASVDDETNNKYTKKAEDIIQLINEGDHDQLTDSFDKTMKEAIQSEDISQIADIVVKAGEFRSFTKSTTTKKDGYITVITMAKYDKATITYTISFNEKDEVSGLWLK